MDRSTDGQVNRGTDGHRDKSDGMDRIIENDNCEDAVNKTTIFYDCQHLLM